MENEPDSRWHRATLAGIVLVTGLLYAATAGLPFFSDSYAHLESMGRLAGIGACFDPDLVPLRPFQHAYFYLLVATGTDTGPLARLVPFALHGCSAWLLFRIARNFGFGGGAAAAATACFLAFPTIKSVAWVAAIGWPGRLLIVALGILAVQRHLQRPSPGPWTAIVPAALVPLALGFHQSGLLLPLSYVLLVWHHHGADRAALRPTLATCRRAWLLVPLAMTAAYLVFIVFLRSNRFHGVVQEGAIAANLVRASLACFPEGLRAFAVEGLRGDAGALGLAGGSMLVGLAVVLFLVAVWRGSPLVRICVIAWGLELLVPVLATGFVVRYAHVAALYLALLLVELVRRARPGVQSLAAGLGVVALVSALAFDHAQDLLELRAAGAHADAITSGLGDLAERTGPDKTITVIDTAYVWGVERDVILFNYGLRVALARAGHPDRFRFLRTQPGWFSSDFERVSPDALRQLLERPPGPVATYSLPERRYRIVD